FLFTRWILEMLWIADQKENRDVLAVLAPFAAPLIGACRFFVTSDGRGGACMPLLGDVSPDFPPEWLISLPWSPLATRWSPTPAPSPAAASGWRELWTRQLPAGEPLQPPQM